MASPKKEAAAKTTDRPLLITTAKGVFFGYGTYTLGDPNITLKQCRNVVYWGKAVRGFLGLAANGPDSTCRIGPAAQSTGILGVTSASECSPEAVANFEKAPWGA
jgi:hypothetical protein